MNDITLTVTEIDIDGSILYTLNTKTCMSILIRIHCHRFGLHKDSYSFYTSTGKEIRDTDTPFSLALKDGDIIEVMEVRESVDAITVQKVERCDSIWIEVTIQDNLYPAMFKLKCDDKIGKFIDTYCKRQGIPKNWYRFCKDEGVWIEDDDTPNSLALNNNDVIYCMYIGE